MLTLVRNARRKLGMLVISTSRILCQTVAHFLIARRFECRTLRRMNTWEWEDGKVVHMARVRLMVRLLELHFNDMIPEEQWAEIQSLTSNDTLKKKEDKESYEGAQVIVTGLRHYTATDLTESEVLELLLAVSYNVQNNGRH